MAVNGHDGRGVVSIGFATRNVSDAAVRCQSTSLSTLSRLREPYLQPHPSVKRVGECEVHDIDANIPH